ncbi:MAG: response regulator [Deltaproteobacteria bacterium]|nr:response regulator [Deltaproteobacteria bacterium]MCB9478701.1 response regulator [Deltaproteobacteria bacterium]MCB9488217.1 response regulator [Deltaproteobacteria bacterium]
MATILTENDRSTLTQRLKMMLAEGPHTLKVFTQAGELVDALNGSTRRNAVLIDARQDIGKALERAQELQDRHPLALPVLVVSNENEIPSFPAQALLGVRWLRESFNQDELDALLDNAEEHAGYSWEAELRSGTPTPEGERGPAEFKEDAKRMEALGRVAMGAVHDLNNILTIIMTHCDFVADAAPESAAIANEVEGIKSAARRAAALTTQLLALSRRNKPRPRRLDVNEVLASMEKMLRRLIHENVELLFEFDPEAGSIVADQSQFEQVVLNLAINAQDAMWDGGTLKIRTSLEESAGNAVNGRAPASGRYVKLSVIDSGVGMSEETRRQIFEPFFTTKARGAGTGLGLSTVRDIIYGFGGTITAESAPGQGTSFHILLPWVDSRAEDEAPEEAGRPKSLHGNETILLVEDEPSVLNLASRILRQYGYSVLTARDGREALALSREQKGPIALMITDVIMPRMSGYKLSAALQAERPEMRTMFVSGHADDVVAHIIPTHHVDQFLRKPFTPEQLVEKVRHLIDRELASA